MTFNAKKLPAPISNRERPPALEAGSYPARLVQLVNIGVQAQRPYKGEEKPPRLMLRLTYELLDEFLKDDEGEDRLDKPRWLSEEFTFMSLSQDLAKSTKRYYALDAEDTADGDWTKLVGRPCMLTIVTEKDKRPGNDTIYEKIASVSAMRPKEAAKAPELVNPPLVWDFYAPDVEVFKSFPDWIQIKIKDAVDFEGSALAEALGASPKTEGGDTTQKPKKAPVASTEGASDNEEDW